MRITHLPMRARHYLQLISFLAALGCPLLHAAELPTPYRAEYEARASGMSATAYRTLEQVGEQRFALSNSLSLKILGASVGEVLERSEFIYNSSVLPQHYQYEQSGVSRRRETVEFDWPALQARSDDNGDATDLTLQAGVQDQLSFTVQLALDLAELPADGLTEGTSFTYRIVDGDEIEEQHYSIAGRENISTPLGEIDTVRVERLRGADSRRRTTFWLSVERNFLLVKLEQVSSSGSMTELLLQSVADIRDTPAP